jgi:MFS family permease
MLVFLGVNLAMFVACLDSTIIAPSLPKIVADLASDESPAKAQSELTWVVVSYLLSSTALQPSYGRASGMDLI